MALMVKKWMLWLAIGFALICALGFLLGRSLPEKEGLLLYEPMLIKRREVERYWYMHSQFREEAPATPASYEKYGFLISVSSVGVIHGVNKSGTVFISLSPRIQEGTLVWDCEGSAVGDIPSGCHRVNGGKEEGEVN